MESGTSRLLDMVYDAIPMMYKQFKGRLSILCFCTPSEVEKYFDNKDHQAEDDYLQTMHCAKWKTHQLYAYSKDVLERMCVDNKLDERDTKSQLVEKLAKKLALDNPPELEMYCGSMSDIPTTISEIKKLPVFKLKQFLRHHKISWIGCKDQLVLRVLGLRTGTKHLLFQRERDSLLDAINIAKKLIHAQIPIHIMEDDFVTRKREYSTPKGPEIAIENPRKSAGLPNKAELEQKSQNSVSEKINLQSLSELIFFELEQDIRTINSNIFKQQNKNNLEVLTACNTKVVVKCTEEDNLGTWKPGWYSATVKG